MAWAEEQSWFGLEDIAVEALEVQNSIKENFIKRDLWTTQCGKKIPISKMTNKHLKNCINKCLREEWRLWAIPKLKTELKARSILQ